MAKIVCITGSKGGVGKTFVAANLAYLAKRESGRPTLLIDANTPTSQQFQEVCEDVDQLSALDSLILDSDNAVTTDAHEIATQWVSVDHHGVDLLAIDSGENIPLCATSDISMAVAAHVRTRALRYFYVVIDLGVRFDAVGCALLDIASDIIVVADAEESGLTRLHKDLMALRKANYPSQRIKYVVNRWDHTVHKNEQWLKSRFDDRALQRTALSGLIPLEEDQRYPFIGPQKKSGKDPKLQPSFQRLLLALDIDTGLSINQQPGLELSTQDSSQIRLLNDDALRQIKILVHEEILKVPDLKHLNTEITQDRTVLKQLEKRIRIESIRVLNEQGIDDHEQRESIIHEVIQSALYLGPLEELLKDESVTEIMVNRWNTIYVERSGKVALSEIEFLSEKHLMTIIDRIIAPLGRRVDMSSPIADARLADGSRVNVIIPPLATKGSVLTIRKFPAESLKIEDLVRYGTINEQVVGLLEAAVICKTNTIISGGTGTGKTTLLNILSSYIPSDERIVTVEDSAELQLRQPHVITLEARPPNIEGKGEITIRDLVKNSLRMRPDRIVVGECRAGEALDMLQAMNTGHDGSMTTIHANSTREMLSRLETLVMYAGTELPSRAIRDQINSAVGMVIQTNRFPDGTRKVTQISEIVGMKDDNILSEDIFVFEQRGVSAEGKVLGEFVSTGYEPKCLSKFEANDIFLPRELFWTP